MYLLAHAVLFSRNMLEGTITHLCLTFTMIHTEPDMTTNYFELMYYRSSQQRFTLFSGMQCSIPNVLIQTGMW